MRKLISSYLEERMDFELFKSQTCHQLKELGDIQFLYLLLQSNDIRRLFNKKWYRESFYLLAMLDYVSKENDVPLCSDFDDLRQLKLDSLIFPRGVILMSHVMKDDEYQEEALNGAIPEFLKFNIVEKDIRNVA